MSNSEQPIGTLLDGYAAKTVEEIDLLVGKGLVGLTAIGNDGDGSPAVMMFAGEKAGAVFLKLVEIMRTLPEYEAFIASLQGVETKPEQPPTA